MRRAAVHRHAERARQHAKVAGIACAAQLAPVQRAVMGRAQRDEIVRAVAATFGARPDVMQIEEGGVPAAGDATAPLIPAQHRAAQRRRDILLGRVALRVGARSPRALPMRAGSRERIGRRAVCVSAAAHVGVGSRAALVVRAMFLRVSPKPGAARRR